MHPQSLAALFAVLAAAFARASEPAEDAARVAAELARLPVGELDTDLPRGASPLLGQLKDDLLAVVQQELDSTPIHGLPAEEIQASVLRRLHDAGLDVTMEASGYGSVNAIEVRRPELHARLLAVTTTVGVMCGSDTSLYLFDESPEGARLRLEVAAGGYEDVGGAQDLFDYAISAPDEAGRFFLAVADVNAWCSSSWQRLRLRILRPGPTPEDPEVLEQSDEVVFLGDEAYGMRIEKDVVCLDFTGGHHLDGARLTRDYIRRYRVSTDRVTLEGPLASSPDGFLDEWIARPWNEIASYTAPDRGRIHAWHDRVRALLHGISTEVDERPIQGRDDAWEVALDVIDQSDPSVLPDGITFVVTHREDRYRIERVLVPDAPAASGSLDRRQRRAR